MPYSWSNNESLRAARLAHMERVDMTTAVVDVRGGRGIATIDNGKLLHHTETFVAGLRSNVRTEAGLTAVAMLESSRFGLDSIAIVLMEVLPFATVAYFQTSDRAWDWKVTDVLIRIFRPVCFDPNPVEDDNEDYNFYLEMKALGIPTWLQVIQALFADLSAAAGTDWDPTAAEIVRNYLARFGA